MHFRRADHVIVLDFDRNALCSPFVLWVADRLAKANALRYFACAGKLRCQLWMVEVPAVPPKNQVDIDKRVGDCDPRV